MNDTAMTTCWLTNCRVFDGDALHERAAVRIDGGRITAVAAAADGSAAHVDLGGRLLVPGFVDLQVNGGGGVLFNERPEPDSLRQIAAAHRRYGTVAMLPTLISDSADTMRRGIAAVREALATNLTGIVGIHLEGPHLSRNYGGVHAPAQFRPLDDDAFAMLTSLDAGRTLVTVAPDQVAPGDIRGLCDAGVVVWGGHSAADHDTTRAALAAGLSGFTHLFNAMPPFHHREPGMVGAALADDDSYIGLIADGFHLHPATLRVAVRAKPRGRAVLVTDAMPPVGAAETAFTLYGERIEARDGRCVTADGRLAGSAIGMIDAVRHAVDEAGIDRYEALRMASTYPATAIGLQDELGRIRPGYRASLVLLDDDWQLQDCWIDGVAMVRD